MILFDDDLRVNLNGSLLGPTEYEVGWMDTGVFRSTENGDTSGYLKARRFMIYATATAVGTWVAAKDVEDLETLHQRIECT